MALKVKAVERKIKFTKDENDPGVYRYVMQPELYIALNQAKVIREAALRSGVSQGVMKACWDAAGEVIKAWATEGQTPTATLNGSSIELTESEGVYSGNFAMPGQASSLVINTGGSGGDGGAGLDKD